MDTTKSHHNVILAICCLSLLAVSMDATIVNVALPDIRRDLGATLSELQWVIDAYTIVLASFLMLGGSTADRLGRRRVFQAGLALFTVGSALCSMATSVGLLVAARVIQGIGRLDDEPGGDVHHRSHVHRTEGARSRHRHVGRGWRAWRWRWGRWRAAC